MVLRSKGTHSNRLDATMKQILKYTMVWSLENHPSQRS